MTARRMKLPLLAFGLFLLTALGAGAAYAQCNCTPPPPCCTPPSPPPPPVPPCCHQVNIPGVNVNVGANVIVNSNAQAFAVAGGSAQGAVFFGGGGGGYSISEGGGGLIGALNVQSPQRTAYEASRKTVKIVVIQAVCVDDQQIPHPASQVTPDKEVAESYDGELFRCIAGTHMQVTIADFSGKIDFDHGKTLSCQKGEALYKTGAGELMCRPQRPARDCNERSLLRRFGAGIKIVKIVTVETYTAYREEMVQTSSASMYTDGGVGGVVH